MEQKKSIGGGLFGIIVLLARSRATSKFLYSFLKQLEGLTISAVFVAPQEIQQSVSEHIAKLQLQEYARVHGFSQKENLFSACNEIISSLDCRFVGILDKMPELAESALGRICNFLEEKPETDILYFDEAYTGNHRNKHFFKPDWSPDLFLSYNYIGDFFVFKKFLFFESGGIRAEHKNAGLYDVLLRMSEKTESIAHIAEPMSYSRMCWQACCEKKHEESASGAHKVLENTLVRRKISGDIVASRFPYAFRVKRKIDGTPKVSIIIPTKNHFEILKTCFESLVKNTTYENYECIIVDNGSTDKKFLAYESDLSAKGSCTLLKYDKPYNFSAINNLAVRHANGEYLVFLNDDTEIIDGEWLYSMLEHAQRKEVGIVGCKLLYKDGAIQHAGVCIGVNEFSARSDVGGHVYKHSPDSFDGYFGMPHLIQNVGAVTAACMLVRKNVFTELGGFDERLAVDFNDVDLCLKARNRGYRIVYTPYAILIHHEALNRGHAETQDKREALKKETEYIKQKWGNELAYDPYYSTNLIQKQRSGFFHQRARLLRLYYKRYGLFFAAKMVFHYIPFWFRNSAVIAVQRFYNKTKKSPCAKMNGTPSVLIVVPSYKVDGMRYRVSHVCEYFSIAHIPFRVISESLATHVCAQDIIESAVILYRLTDSEEMGRFVQNVKQAGKKIFYSIDDLLFSPHAARYFFPLPNDFCESDRDFYVSQAHARLSLLKKCDYFLGTTEFLAKQARPYVKQSFVLRNGYCAKQLEIAHRLMRSPYAKNEKSVVIGYVSGTQTHEHDFAVVRAVLINILDEEPYAELKIIGFLSQDSHFKRFGKRFIHVSFIPWTQIFSHLRAIDINIAPLESGNPFTQSKSEIKYIEAALMKIPTVASPVEAHLYAIEHGRNGLIASTEKEWHACLSALIRNKQLRKDIGECAYAHALSRYSPKRMASETRSIVEI